MKALINSNKDLQLVEDMPEPKAKPGEVTVKVHYASLNPTDLDIAKGSLDFFLKLSGAKSPVRTGLEFSGMVLEDSARFQKGDRVFGYTHLLKGPKAHQEVLAIPEDFVAAMPDTVSFAEAAAFPIGAQTSLVALRDVAGLKSGQSVLIIGASGGVGVFAVQIAKSMKIHVKAVSGPSGLETVKSLGADQIINYRETPIEALTGTFDAIFDLSDNYRFKHVKHLLASKGTFIPVDPTKHLLDFALNPFRRRKVGYLYEDKGKSDLLSDLINKVAAGSLDASHYQEFPIADFNTAVQSLEGSGNIGRTLLRME